MMKKRHLCLLAAMMCALLLFVSCERQPDASAQNTAPSTDTEAEGKLSLFGPFVTEDIYGREKTDEIFAAKDLTMVNFWATYCTYCLEEMPDLGALNLQYGSKGVQVVGVVVNAADSKGKINASKVAEAQEKARITQANYTHLVPSKEMMKKVNSIRGIPETVFVDAQGKVVDGPYYGIRSKEDWSRILDALLADEKT